MTTPFKGDIAPNPNWVTFWQRVRAAAKELERIEAEQIAGELRSVCL